MRTMSGKTSDSSRSRLYRRATTSGELSDALLARRYAHAERVPTDLRWMLALASVACLIAASLTVRITRHLISER